ncbi:hypothetical protein BDK51DRAFT_20897 [Blyttiomyces helicus]|uniref:Integrase zinc-binding domain-containing protein n=1 Tax=Blyttiomyces helicus TaxID=388810 RepID=A0A4P9WKZ9_9FUNG|nr:hypothetical protein BDK51DRAFT_20897 [Blyttiomyces helicus]|eukprot:RKO93691.1 hypothetical protein BDK51DRAFT_20897 [Blyttiomyces helicus]
MFRHFRLGETLAALVKDFPWPTMWKDTKVYFRSCYTCYLNKDRILFPPGAQRNVPIPDHLLDDICLDWTSPFPLTLDRHYTLLVLCDRKSSLVRVIPTTKDTTPLDTEKELYVQ